MQHRAEERLNHEAQPHLEGAAGVFLRRHDGGELLSVDAPHKDPCGHCVLMFTDINTDGTSTASLTNHHHRQHIDMSGLPRPGAPAATKRTTTSMRPPASRQATNGLMRGRSATPMLDGRTSRAESVASTRTRGTPRSSPLKRKAADFDDGGSETNINVVVRCRGRNDRELRENSGVVVTTNGIKGNTVNLSMGPSALSNKTYQFDKVFSPAADQTTIFDEVVVPIIDEVRST